VSGQLIELHRRSDGAPLLVNMKYVVAMFEGRYGKGDGTVIRLEQGTYEVSESLASIGALLAKADD
jgi:hypothetical protein